MNRPLYRLEVVEPLMNIPPVRPDTLMVGSRDVMRKAQGGFINAAIGNP